VGCSWTACACSPGWSSAPRRLQAEQLHNAGAACRSRLRSTRWAAQTLHRLLQRKSETKEQDQRAHYQKLIETAEQMVRQTARVTHALQQQSESVAKRLREQAERVVPLVKRVITQTRSRTIGRAPVQFLPPAK
jgi:hypothetical protein